jgi:hypothetical protein
MIGGGVHSRLRLAARILIEWKTPKDSPDYQRVLHEVIAQHPLAQQVDLINKTNLMRLDDSSVILWYLSDSMDRPVTAGPPTSDEAGIMELTTSILREMLAVSADVDASRPLWTRGPTKAAVADAILQTITTDIEHIAFGYRAYFGMRIPLNASSLRVGVDGLLRNVKRLPTLIQRLSRDVRVLRNLFSLASVVIGLLNALWLASGLFGRGRSNFFRFSGVNVFDELRRILPRMINDFIHFLNFIAPNHAFGTLTAALFSASMLTASLTWLFLGRSLENNIVLRLILAVTGRRVSDDSNKSMNLNVRAVHDTRMRLISEDEDSTIAEAKFVDGLGLACGVSPGVLAGILRQPRLRQWSRAALASTSFATAEIVQEVLHLLQLPEFDDNEQRLLFRWLAHIYITEDIDITEEDAMRDGHILFAPTKVDLTAES